MAEVNGMFGIMLTTQSSLAMTELYLTIAIVFRQFEFEMFETTEERDVMITGDCNVGMVDVRSLGIRARVMKVSG